ncbi:MAG: type II secretion system GspH family protein [Nitrospirota bacterium]|nr:type II secretion system GspH family protein [Nitrospirota bacterium]
MRTIVPPHPGAGRRGDSRGLTLIELLVVIAIVGILAGAVMPLSRMTMQRMREAELRSGLRTLRNAIDAFNRDCVAKRLASDNCTKDNYPESLEQLTEPLKLTGTGDKTRKYLRRIPRDPLVPTESSENMNNWGMRSTSDQPDSTQWGGENVYDVYSKSDATALDDTKYSAW